MSNRLQMDLTDKIVLLRKESLRPQFHADKERCVRVTGGFGARPDTIGSALIVTWLSDGEVARMEGFDVDRLVTPEELVEWGFAAAEAS